MRLALGSSRGRVVRESLVESVLLAFVAVPLSLGVSWLFLTVIRASMPARVMRFVAGWNSMRVDAPLVGATVGLAVLAAVVFGLLPALQISRSSVSDALKADGRGGDRRRGATGCAARWSWRRSRWFCRCSSPRS